MRAILTQAFRSVSLSFLERSAVTPHKPELRDEIPSPITPYSSLLPVYLESHDRHPSNRLPAPLKFS